MAATLCRVSIAPCFCRVHSSLVLACVTEQCCDRFIPNDTHLDSKSECTFHVAVQSLMGYTPGLTNSSTGGLVHLITGPNNSGKSVYLKQVGLCVYLAHVGSVRVCGISHFCL